MYKQANIDFLNAMSELLSQHSAYLWVNKDGAIEYACRNVTSDGVDLEPHNGIINFADPKYNVTASDILLVASRLETANNNIENLYGD